jgi:hypothetical protein
MVTSSGLVPIVLGIGLAVVSGSAVAGARNRDNDSRDPLFVFAVLLVGFAILAAALYLLGWSIERGQKLPPVEARTENWLALALALLVIAPAARSAWIGIFSGEERPPWDRGFLDRVSQGLNFAMGSMAALLVGLVIVAVVFLIAKLEPAPAILLVAAAVIVGLTSAWAILRATAGREASLRGLSISRKAQLKRLSSLEQADGHWQAIEVSTIGRLDRPIALQATIYLTDRGMFWAAEDASALVRFHDWAANHLLAPTPAVHKQRLVIANLAIRADRHLEVKRWGGRRAQLLDSLRLNRVSRPVPLDAASPERVAGLVHVPYEQLRSAGLRMAIVEPAAR